MNETDFEVREFLLKGLHACNSSLQIAFFGLLDQGIYYIYLSARFCLAVHQIVDDIFLKLANHLCENRGPVRRQFIDEGVVEVPVKCDGECPRDRCRRHYKRIRIGPLFPQLGPLHNSEAVLFVDNNQSEILKGDGFLYQGMGTDDNLRLPRCDHVIILVFLAPSQ